VFFPSARQALTKLIDIIANAKRNALAALSAADEEAHREIRQRRGLASHTEAAALRTAARLVRLELSDADDRETLKNGETALGKLLCCNIGPNSPEDQLREIDNLMHAVADFECKLEDISQPATGQTLPAAVIHPNADTQVMPSATQRKAAGKDR